MCFLLTFVVFSSAPLGNSRVVLVGFDCFDLWSVNLPANNLVCPYWSFIVLYNFFHGVVVGFLLGRRLDNRVDVRIGPCVRLGVQVLSFFFGRFGALIAGYGLLNAVLADLDVLGLNTDESVRSCKTLQEH